MSLAVIHWLNNPRIMINKNDLVFLKRDQDMPLNAKLNPRWAKFFGNTVLIVVSVALSIGVVEVFLGHFGYQPERMFPQTEGSVIDGKIEPGLIGVQDPIQIFELNPSQTVCAKERCETINKYGFRGTGAKPINTDVFRIAMVGDSFTYGYGVDDHETLPVHMEHVLNSKGKEQFQVFNFGIAGYNTAQTYRLLVNKVIPFKPHVVIYNYFPNDPELYRKEGNPLLYECASMFSWKRPVLKTLVGSHLVEFISRRIGLRHKAHHGQDENYWNLVHHPLWPGWWVIEQAFKGMKKTTEEAGIRFCVVLLPYDDMPNQSKKVFHNTIELCERLGIPAIDISGCFVGISLHDELWTTVGPPHYSNYGNKIVAKSIVDQLLKW